MHILFSVVIFSLGLMAGFLAIANYAQNNSIHKAVVDTFVGNWETIEEKKVEDQQVVAWIPYWDQERAFQSFTTNIDSFDYVSLFWYYLDKNGDIVKYIPAREDKSIIAIAHSNGVKVLALIANLPDAGGGDWDAVRVNRVISSPQARAKHIEDILEIVRRHNFDGINIDYESLEASHKNDFTSFIKELSEALHKENKIVALALHPKTAEGRANESNGSQAQDWKELGNYADQLHIMTYEQYNASTKPGPSAESTWNKRVIAYAKKLIPIEKIYFGVGLYGYEWPKDSEREVRGLTSMQIDHIIASSSPRIMRDPASQEAHFVYENDEGQEFEVWYNDVESVAYKLHFAKEEGVGGVGLWRLGGEDPRVWELMMRQ